MKFGSGSNQDSDEDDRPSRRRNRRHDRNEDNDRPSRRRRTRYDEDEEDRPSRRRSRRYDEDDSGPLSKPSDVQTLGVLLLVGGISALLLALGVAGGSTGLCCLWPGTYYELVYGIMAIVRGSQLLGRNDSPDPPRSLFIMAIICIANIDVLNLILGIVGLNMLNNPSVQEYYNRR